ncbi:adenine nucleotide alpha hydrolases-like protein [Metschnikowia bicuspidata var. bicuspidata NRRL YB-4993]|uniref:FAD synthase n=1 Tax=Metschnikowia bicuspidata var. bicuspidata NRRL YB-4993 TaxID=869754 RepID=A0A1A0HFK8_9ASCO|nr:adenine nucleotide alpha hydrolases-like protein [Metschnikowia bicuspidata var. bicuspidata NRRL YB-4993]OBA22786.1 adenine nucleotide alpha hydrolases-like protein [Metschnikowia bicuspidata var. bicuspidata NRRL YB-4993]
MTLDPGPPPILEKCAQAHRLVQGFLAGSLPLAHLASLEPPYIVRPPRRQVVREKVKKSLEVLESALESHSLEEIAVSYNGGKDCLVMLTLLLAAIHRKVSLGARIPANYKLDSIYVNSEKPFPELSRFIELLAKEYLLNPITISSSMKQGFEQYLTQVNCNTKAIVVGIRYADPYGALLQYEQETDHNWPKFLRIHPILHWHYCDVWDFILACGVPYCELYDQGYTSLGGVDTTLPNIFLRLGDSYLPAYMLEDFADERERVGRMKSR